MISLDVQDYCHNCSEFEPEYGSTTYTYDGERLVDTVVECGHRNLCSYLKSYIEQQLTGKESR